MAGLTEIGDFGVTCTSIHSRNRRAGILIGEGMKPSEAVKKIGTVEGYMAAKVARELAKQVHVEMPITNELYNILFKDKDCKSAIKELMGRPKRHETEEKWKN